MERNKDGLTEAEFLAQYNPGDYKRPSVTTDILVLSVAEDYASLKLLLIKRADHPFINHWALPGGFIEDNETAHQAANRELYEETGLKDLYLDQIYTFTKPGRDPRMWVMSIAYLALIPNIQEVKGYDDAKEAAWFDVFFLQDKLVLSNKDLNVQIVYDLEKKTFKNSVLTYENYIPTWACGEKLAFDHVEIIIEALQKLRKNFDHSDKIFCLMPETFTMADLRRVYTLVMEQPVYKATLKGFVNKKIVPTGNTKKSKVKHGRQSVEFKYNNKEEK